MPGVTGLSRSTRFDMLRTISKYFDILSEVKNDAPSPAK
jgi:hypothetical protein